MPNHTTTVEEGQGSNDELGERCEIGEIGEMIEEQGGQGKGGQGRQGKQAPSVFASGTESDLDCVD